MKKIFISLSIAALCAIGPAYAQQYRPVEQPVSMDKTTPNAWVINADDAPVDELQKAFRRYAKDQLDVKAKRKGRDMVVAKEASIPRFSSRTGDLKAKFFTEGNQTKVAVAFMPGYDISLSTAENQEGMESMRMFVKNFVKHYKSEQLTAQLEDREKRKKSIESDYKKNEREYKKLNKNISKTEKKMNSDKTEESERFELKNEKIENEARIMALDEVMANQQEEIKDVSGLIRESQTAISQLETMFSEPMARQNMQSAPPKAAGDSIASPNQKTTPAGSPDIDY